MPSRTILFIHGMYMTPLCWGAWLQRFQANGYHSIAPAWPGRDKPIEVLRQPDAQIAALTLHGIIDHMVETIRALPEPPILVGHSMGGLIVQLLLQRGSAAAGVAINSAPPQGVFSTQWSFIKSNWPHINPFPSKNQPVLMSFERFQYAFANGLPLEVQRSAYETYVVPESRRVAAESLTSVAHVDFAQPGAPLLLIAGSADHIIPASLNRSNFAKYRRPHSITDFKEFDGRTHFIIGQSGWEEVADYVASWLNDRGM